MTNEEQIRTLIEQWAAAVHQGDLDGVCKDHASDIVMFDVPPPHRGVRGIEAYGATWPPFFEWQAKGAVFEIESLEVTAGDDVAFAHALLRCGTPQDRADTRLRLTFGLRKEGGRWVVAHEHHSFPLADQAEGEREVLAVHQDWFEGTANKDLDGMMTHIADDIVSYEHEVPLQVLSVAEVREHCRYGLESSTGAVTWTVPDLKILIRDDIAVAWGLNEMRHETTDGEPAESWSRGTRVFQRRGAEWLMIHQHVSFPFDPETGAVETGLRP
jgi:uncharacterized protein (TIGR02246 family)